MRDEILKLIASKPKHYTKLIKSNPVLLSWVYNHSIIESESIVAHIRSAVYNESNICPNGNLKKITRFNDGFIGCGPAKKCQCVAENISNKVSETKSKTPIEEKLATNQKRAATMLERYGVAHNLQRAEVKEKIAKPKISIPTHTLLSDKSWLHNEYVVKQRTLVDIAADLSVYYSTVGDYCRQHGFDIRQRSQYSLVEKEVADYVKSLGFDTALNDRTVLGGKEIDILIPEKNLGIEVNGLYWHSYSPTLEKKENRNQHANKQKLAGEANIQLLQFTDHQWITKQDIVKSIISSKLGVTDRIYARKCLIKEISAKEARHFFNTTHIDGFASARQYCGLFYNGELVQCVSIGTKRFGDRSKLEIIRFSTKLNTTVVGGLSKIISYINKPLVTFCSKDISNAKGYIKAGFKVVEETGPGYFWTDGTRVISRQKAQKKNLGKWLLGFDPLLSEANNMFRAGYRRYWNSGNFYLEL